MLLTCPQGRAEVALLTSALWLLGQLSAAAQTPVSAPTDVFNSAQHNSSKLGLSSMKVKSLPWYAAELDTGLMQQEPSKPAGPSAIAVRSRQDPADCSLNLGPLQNPR